MKKSSRAKAITQDAPAQSRIWVMALMGLLVVATIWSFSRVAEARGAPDSFADLAEKLLPAVVNIQTLETVTDEGSGRSVIPNLPPDSPFRDFFDDFFPDNPSEGQERQMVGTGSGFFISTDGYIVTNNHVVGQADMIMVRTHDGRDFEATLVGRDVATDLALLKVEVDHPVPALSFGDSDVLRVGDWVLAIGNPFGFGGSVTAGIVSGRNRDINAGRFDEFIQTDASINRGNSGGPMFNMDGDVVGVTTMIFSPNGGNVGIGFAIPSNQVSDVITQIKEFGRARRGRMGVTIGDVTQEVADSLGLERAAGAIVSSVIPGDPADQAGMENGDIILRFAGKDVEDSRGLVRIVASTAPGTTVDVQVWRNGDIIDLRLTTAELVEDDEETPSTEAPVTPNTPQGDDRIGMYLSDLDNGLRAQFEVPNDINGVVIIDLVDGSDAERRGLSTGDVIVGVNQTVVNSLSDFDESIEDVQDAGRPAVLLRVFRAGGYFFMTLPLGDGE